MSNAIASFFLLLLSTNSFAGPLTNCEYYKTQVLKLDGGKGEACSQTKLCSAEILCTKTLPSGKQIDVTRNIICALDSTGRCPTVETCRSDMSTATYENEAQIGSAGNTDWSVVAIKLAPIMMEALVRQQNGLPIEPVMDKLNGIDELKDKTKSGEK